MVTVKPHDTLYCSRLDYIIMYIAWTLIRKHISYIRMYLLSSNRQLSITGIMHKCRCDIQCYIQALVYFHDPAVASAEDDTLQTLI